MELLERLDILDELEGFTREAARGNGCLVALAGEAGAGKTAVVEALGERSPRFRFLIGRCDSLSTPRPLGPLHEIADADAASLSAALRAARPRHEVFDAVLEDLRTSIRPSVMVLEDAHWADDATLDLIRFVGRRVSSTHGLVLVTYRDDEVGPDHPLTAVLGDLSTARRVHRRRLDRLSVEAVAELSAGSDIDPLRLHQATRGNPFFVTEVLSGGVDPLPTTISDAVLARASRASPGARAVIDAAAVVPDHVETWLLRRLVDFDDDDRSGAIAVGLLVADQNGLRFRHELARRAVEASLDPARRVEMHRRVIIALEDPPSGRPDPARLTHHAEHAGDDERVVRWGMPAAAAAVREGAFREGRSHDRRLLERLLDRATRAGVLERYARTCRLLGEADIGLAAAEEAVLLRRELGEAGAIGASLAELAVLRWWRGDGPGARSAIEESLSILEPDLPELGSALATAAHLAMLGRDVDRAIALGRRSLALASAHDDRQLAARVVGTVGTARIVSGDPGGEADLLSAVELGESANELSLIAQALGNLGAGFGEVRDYERATRYLQLALEHAQRYDLDAYADYDRAWSARIHFEQGRWGVAVLQAEQSIRRPTTAAITTIVAHTVLGRVAVRRGEPAGTAHLEQASRLADETGDLQRTWPVAAALAEASWLRGDREAISGIVGPVLDEAMDRGMTWAVGELAYWSWRSDSLDRLPAGMAEPYRLQVVGDWREAAAAWRQLGCPYEEADALADGDTESQLDAIRIWDEIGAGPRPARVRSFLRAQGVAVPRGPRAATRGNPSGLTARQLEVLGLLEEGLSNAAIAARLFVSSKTVDHHVSAILAKLGVASRGEAAAVARRMSADDPA